MATMSPASALVERRRAPGRGRPAAWSTRGLLDHAAVAASATSNGMLGLIAPDWMRPVRMRPRKRIGLERRHEHRERLVGLDRAAPAHGAGSGRTAAPCPCARPRARSRPSPARPEANRVGKSSCSSLAPSAANRSNTSSCTSCGARVRAVDLVDHDDRAAGRGAAPCRARTWSAAAALRRRRPAATTPSTMRQDALDLAAEIGVARRVDDVDARALPDDRGALGEDGDAALALQVVGIHGALGDLLVVAEGAALLQQAVDQRGLAMVDVGDDGDVADVHKMLFREGVCLGALIRTLCDGGKAG